MQMVFSKIRNVFLVTVHTSALSTNTGFIPESLRKLTHELNVYKMIKSFEGKPDLSRWQHGKQTRRYVKKTFYLSQIFTSVHYRIV